MDRGTVTLKVLPCGRLTGDRLADQAALRWVMNRIYFRPTEVVFDEILTAMSAKGYDMSFDGELDKEDNDG